MATISSLGDGGKLNDFDKIPVARLDGTNAFIFGKNATRSVVSPLIESSSSIIINNDDYNNRTVLIDNGTTNVTITLTNLVTVGLQVSFIRTGTGTVTFVAGAGANIRTSPTPLFVKMAFQNSAATAYYGATNGWYIFGDLIT